MAVWMMLNVMALMALTICYSSLEEFPTGLACCTYNRILSTGFHDMLYDFFADHI